MTPSAEPDLRIEVSIAKQELRLFKDGVCVCKTAVSSAAAGLGSAEGSWKTPTGRFLIQEKIGEGAPLHTIFRGRQPRGVYRGALTSDGPKTDAILTRILWLHGLEEQNANTYGRYIYLHGTHAEDRIGTPASHGCIRLPNAAMKSLFDQVTLGTEVVIV